MFSLLFLFASYKASAKNDSFLVSKDPDKYYTEKMNYKSIIPWRKGIYVSGNVDTYNPEMIPEFSQEIVEGIRSSRKKRKKRK